MAAAGAGGGKVPGRLLRILCALVERICGCVYHRPTLLTTVEFLELVGFAIASTTMLVEKSPTNGIFMSAFLIVLPLESMAHGLFHELGNCLGGTCVGYAVVIPTNFCSPDGQPTLLPPEHVQELNLRSTGMLNAIQRFFAYHMIETYGCDYSTSGLTFDTLHSKIKSFLELRTADGPRHDTYILYYSGHSHGTGEWALAGGDALRLDTLLEWWREKNGTFCSRLIIVLDCENSQPWVKEVRKVNDQYVAVQGAEMARVVDIEEADPPQLGDFTRQWVEYNCNPDSNISWSEKGRTVKALYGVSKHWSDYTLHLPTGSDVAKHWMMYFPRITYPLVHLANWFCGLNLFWIKLMEGSCVRSSLGEEAEGNLLQNDEKDKSTHLLLTEIAEEVPSLGPCGTVPAFLLTSLDLLSEDFGGQWRSRVVTVVRGDGHLSGNPVSRAAEKGVLPRTEPRAVLWHIDWLSTRTI
ncbi:hypothetical protein DUI87_12917 [Hirundo rustica rustica]|uniref:Transmembrane protein 168 n=1 Tax=Hirundo rustica rustica TaxID=333673 RepID=A0A3M0KAB3_HIRRU|nr:hypothetical protein DUI87_12917 [Hirundo rustica rustica]